RYKNADMPVWMFTSRDEGETFENGHCCLPRDRYFVTEMERVFRLPSGRIIIPAGEHGKTQNGYANVTSRSRSVFFYSDDEGKTFTEADIQESGEDAGRPGFQEPGAVLLPDGRLMAYARTGRGCQCIAFSEDQGESFTPYKETPLFPSPISPMSVKPLEDGRLIAVFNPIPEAQTGWETMWSRSPLVYRTSRDGIHWGPMTVLETQNPDASYCYTSVFSDGGFVLLAYCAGTREDKLCLNRLRVVRIPLSEIR
ncbi:MAG: glycoside hydrolase, partial [Clostridia bacterium]|nr:glycoside hydrolase [Clostridia bacterium]